MRLRSMVSLAALAAALHVNAASADVIRHPIPNSTFPIAQAVEVDRKSTRLNSSHLVISHAVFCLNKKNAGHGINYTNIRLIREVPHLYELNIGHSIISRAIFTGLEAALREMLALMNS